MKITGVHPQGLTATDKKEQQYSLYKLGRKSDAKNPHPPMVEDGFVLSRATAHVFDWDKQAPVQQEKFVPQIGKCVLVDGGLFDSVRTSLIEDFYIHEDYENSKDKIVLKPENAHLLDTIKFNDGDVLLVTMNSLYFLKALEG